MAGVLAPRALGAVVTLGYLKQEGWASLKSIGKEGRCPSDLLKIVKGKVRDPAPTPRYINH
jgi:hypothetical protein